MKEFRKWWQRLGGGLFLLWFFLSGVHNLAFIEDFLSLIQEGNWPDRVFYSLLVLGFLAGPILGQVYMFYSINKISGEYERLNIAMWGIYLMLFSFLISLFVKREFNEEFINWPNYILVAGMIIFMIDSCITFKNCYLYELDKK